MLARAIGHEGSKRLGTFKLINVLEGRAFRAEVCRGALASDATRAVHEHSAIGQRSCLAVQPCSQLAEAAQLWVQKLDTSLSNTNHNETAKDQQIYGNLGNLSDLFSTFWMALLQHSDAEN